MPNNDANELVSCKAAVLTLSVAAEGSWGMSMNNGVLKTERKSNGRGGIETKPLLRFEN